MSFPLLTMESRSKETGFGISVRRDLLEQEVKTAASNDPRMINLFIKIVKFVKPVLSV